VVVAQCFRFLAAGNTIPATRSAVDTVTAPEAIMVYRPTIGNYENEPCFLCFGDTVEIEQFALQESKK
jgi:hypothetical protein